MLQESAESRGVSRLASGKVDGGSVVIRRNECRRKSDILGSLLVSARFRQVFHVLERLIDIRDEHADLAALAVAFGEQ